MEDVVNERYHGWRMPGASLHSSTTSSGIVSTYEGKQNFFVGGMLSGDTLQSPSVPQAMMPGACQATQNFLVGGMLSGDALQSPSVPQPTISMATRPSVLFPSVGGAMIPSVPSPCVLMESSSKVLISSVTKHAKPVRASQSEPLFRSFSNLGQFGWR